MLFQRPSTGFVFVRPVLATGASAFAASRASATACALAVALLCGAGCEKDTSAPGPDMSAADAAYSKPVIAAVQNAEERAAKQPLDIEPAKISLGVISPCDGQKKATATITNKTGGEVVVRRVISTCACATAQVVGDRTLKAGESRTVEIAIDPSGTGGKSQGIHLVGASGPLGTIRVDYEIIPPVATKIEMHDIGESAKSVQVDVARHDGQPVKLLRLEPAIGEIRTLPDGKQVVMLDLAKADAYAASEEGQADGSFRRDADGTWVSMYAVVVTDYPGCPNASVFVRRVR